MPQNGPRGPHERWDIPAGPEVFLDRGRGGDLHDPHIHRREDRDTGGRDLHRPRRLHHREDQLHPLHRHGDQQELLHLLAHQQEQVLPDVLRPRGRQHRGVDHSRSRQRDRPQAHRLPEGVRIPCQVPGRREVRGRYDPDSQGGEVPQGRLRQGLLQRPPQDGPRRPVRDPRMLQVHPQRGAEDGREEAHL